MEIDTRNLIVTEFHNMIWWTIGKNRSLIKALQMEDEDVFQELAIAAIKAVDSYDSDRQCQLSSFVSMKLQYEILNLKRRHKPHGITGSVEQRIVFSSMDHMRETGFEIAATDPEQSELSEIFAFLTPQEHDALQKRMDGYALRGKIQRESFEGARKKIEQYYNERGMAA